MSETNPGVPTENALPPTDVVTPPSAPEPMTPVTPTETPAAPFNPDHPIAFNAMTGEVKSVGEATRLPEPNPVSQSEQVLETKPVAPLPPVTITVPDPVQQIDIGALRQKAAEAQATTTPVNVEPAPQLPPQPQPEPNGLMRFWNKLRGK